MLKTKDYWKERKKKRERKRYDLVTISVTKPVAFVQTKFSSQYPTAQGEVFWASERYTHEAFRSGAKQLVERSRWKR